MAVMKKKRGARKQYKKKAGRRRRYGRRKNVMPYNSSFARLKHGFPQRMYTKLTYCDNRIFTIDTSDGPLMNFRVYKYRSSMFDPDAVNSGAQPLYYKQFTDLYHKYRVFGISYRIEIINTNTNQLMPGILYVGTTLADIMTPGYDQWALAEEQKDTRLVRVQPAGAGPTVVKGYISVAKTAGVPKAIVRTTDGYAAAWNSNTANEIYLHIYLSSFNISPNNQANIRVRLTYYCEFFNLREAFASIAPGESFVPPDPVIPPVDDPVVG